MHVFTMHRLGKRDKYQCQQITGTFSVEHSAISNGKLPNDWSQLHDGSLQATNTSMMVPKVVVDKLVQAFPGRREILGLSSHILENISSNNVSLNADEAPIEQGDSGTNQELAEDSSGSVVDILAQKVLSYRPENREEHHDKSTRKIYTTPSHHDFDIGLGGSCNFNACNCRKNIFLHVTNLKNLYHTSIPSTPLAEDNDETDEHISLSVGVSSDTPSDTRFLGGNIIRNIKSNIYSPPLLESISGLSYDVVGKDDVFPVALTKVLIPMTVFLDLFYVDSNDKLQKKDGFGIVANAYMEEVDLKHEQIVWTCGNMTGCTSTGTNVLTSLYKGMWIMQVATEVLSHLPYFFN